MPNYHSPLLPIFAGTLLVSGCLLQPIQQPNDLSAPLTRQLLQPGAAVAIEAPIPPSPLLLVAPISAAVAEVPPAPKTVLNPEVVVSAPPSKPETAADICLEPRDLWSRIREANHLTGYQHRRVLQEINWYSSHPSYLDRVAERATPYLHILVSEAERRQLPMELALLPIVESAFQPFAYSHGRAAGLWQFIPATGTRYGLKQSWWYDGRRDVVESTRAAYDYLEYLNRYFDGDWLLALAAYNSGEGTVRKAIKKNQKRGHSASFWDLDLPQETRDYVPKLIAITTIVNNPPAYGVVLPSIDDTPFLTTVETGSQIDLDLAAELAGISLEDIYRYNPGFNRWATDPEGPHTLQIPITQLAQFEEGIAQYPERDRITWKRHKIRSGEVLGSIAEQYQTTVTLIKQVNEIKGNNIRVGQLLTIPVARQSLQRYQLSSTERMKQLQNRDRDGQRIEHTVQPGDTLWDLARTYGVSSAKMASWNGMAPRDTLRPGQTLVLWTDEAPAISNPASFTHPYESKTRQKIAYTVRAGDSLARIGDRFKVSVAHLKQWNSAAQDKYLQPGDRLVMYVDVRKQSGGI